MSPRIIIPFAMYRGWECLDFVTKFNEAPLSILSQVSIKADDNPFVVFREFVCPNVALERKNKIGNKISFIKFVKKMLV